MQHPDTALQRTWRRFRALPPLAQLIIALVIIGFVGSAGVSAAYSTLTSQIAPMPQATPTRGVPPTATPAPTKKAVSVSTTHGRPHLGGPVSDFFGKYGASQNTQPGSASWLLNDTDILLLHFDAQGVVNYINYSGPDTWSKEQYTSYLLTFAPSGSQENAAANTSWKNSGGDPYNPIAYTSPSGKFFLHISGGIGYMNTLS